MGDHSHSLFQAILISLQMWKAYFEDHLSDSSSTKENGLSYKGYYKDTPNKFDDVGDSGNGTASLNDGFLKRKAMFAGSKWVYFCINLLTDITTLRKYIPPEIKIEMEFQRNTPEFCLLNSISIFISGGIYFLNVVISV